MLLVGSGEEKTPSLRQRDIIYYYSLYIGQLTRNLDSISVHQIWQHEMIKNTQSTQLGSVALKLKLYILLKQFGKTFLEYNCPHSNQISLLVILQWYGLHRFNAVSNCCNQLVLIQIHDEKR